MTVREAIKQRETDSYIVVTFSFRYGEWIGHELFNNDKHAPFPHGLNDETVWSVNTFDDVTVIEI